MKPVIFLLILMVSIFSCSDEVELEQGSAGTNKGAYQISICDPMGPHDFYHQLYDSLNARIGKLSGNSLANLVKPNVDADSFLGWLQDQFDNFKSGLGYKASFKSERDRTSDEFLLKAPGNSRNAKASFSVNYRADSISNELLYPDLWKRTIVQQGLEKRVQAEKETFQQAGMLIRTNNGVKDTLYVYSYDLNIDVTLNYYMSGKAKAVTSKFSIPARVGVYHQLKFQ